MLEATITAQMLEATITAQLVQPQGEKKVELKFQSLNLVQNWKPVYKSAKKQNKYRFYKAPSLICEGDGEKIQRGAILCDSIANLVYIINV